MSRFKTPLVIPDAHAKPGVSKEVLEEKRLVKNLKQRLRRERNRYLDCKKYEKTKKGFLMRTYRNMKSRVSGIQRLKSHLYLGLTILPREDFYKFSLASEDFNKLFDIWEASMYDRKLSPSINRINSNKGYILDNIEWVTHSENSRLGSISRHHGGIN